MSFLRSILNDLVEKKLWPVAVALLAALVAVPVVLGGGSDAEPAQQAATPAPSSAVTGTPAAAKVVSLEPQGDARVKRDGKVLNPFVQHHVPKATVQPGATLTGGGAAGDAGQTGGTGGDAPSTPATTPKPDTTATDTYKVTLRFGKAGEERTIEDVARLTPLPSSTDPFFIFMGIKDDGETAVFLVSSDAVPTGDGTCRPSPDVCETLELKVGDTEFFDMQSGTAGLVQYQLELTDIDKESAKSAAKAKAARLRESAAGREAIRAVMASNPSLLEDWQFSKSLGLLVLRADADETPDVAHVPTDVAAFASGNVVAPTSTTPAP